MAPKPSSLQRSIFLNEIKTIFQIAEKKFLETSENKPEFLPYAHLSFLGIDTLTANNFLIELRDHYKIIQEFSSDSVGMSFDILFYLPVRNCIENVESDWIRLQKHSERLIVLEDNKFKYNGVEWSLSNENFLVLKVVYLLSEETGFSGDVITYKEIIAKFKAITGRKNIDNDKVTRVFNTKSADRSIFKKHKEWEIYNGEKVFNLVWSIGIEFRNPII
jgi:hypothetical protein